jgi:phenylacetic acid degradation operon negative regulatory protein
MKRADDRPRAKPQRLLVTLLGDHWRGKAEHIPSTALLRLLAEFGVSAKGARSALSRLVRRGLLARSRRGRRTSYGLTNRGLALLDEGAKRIFRFGLEQARWDGTWSVVAFSVAEANRDRRHLLRTRLRWLGFGPLYPGLWISPHPHLEEAATALDDLGIHDMTVFKGIVPSWGSRPGDFRKAWDLDSLRESYIRYLERFRPVRARMRAGRITAREALVMRTRVMDEWRKFPRADPDLPDAFLPADWPRREARALFAELFRGLGPAAEKRVAEIVEQDERFTGASLASKAALNGEGSKSGTSPNRAA